MASRLEDKRALVTGGANGMGREVALGFAREGARVVVTDSDQALLRLGDEAGSLGLELWLSACDVSKEEDVASTIEDVRTDLGGLDILYNNAGIYLRGRGDGPAHDLSVDVWNSVLSVNATGVFLFAKHAVPLMREAGGGSIINISSLAAVTVSDCHAYAASKGAVIALTRSLAHTYARWKIRSNAIAPGLVLTPMSAAALAADPVLAEQFTADTPLGPAAGPAEVVPLAIYLASDESAYVTGITLPFDGGWHVRA